MMIHHPAAADAIGRARLAADLAVAQDAETTRVSALGRARTAALATASALAQALAWPVSRAARLTGVVAERVWDARREPPPGFLVAEREARAAAREAMGDLAPPQSPLDWPEPDEPQEPDTDVIRLRPVSPAILRWSRAYVRMGAAVDDLAELFSVSLEALAAAVENGVAQ